MKKWILKVFFSTCMLLMLYSVPAMAAEATTVTVGGTALNKDEYLKKDFTQGSATDYNFYFSGGKLVLNDADGIGSVKADGDLILELSGSSSVSDGIFVDGDLTIDGDGTLTATATPLLSTSYTQTYGMKVTKTLTINNGTITANGGGSKADACSDFAIYAETVIINGGQTTVNGGDANSNGCYTYGIEAESVTVNGGILNVYGGNIYADSCYSRAVKTDYGSFTVNNNSVVYIKGGTGLEGAASIINGLDSSDIVLNGGNTTLESGSSATHRRKAFTSSVPKIQMPFGIWKSSPDGEYSLASVTPYAPNWFSDDIPYLNVKPMEIVVTPQLQINSTTGEWEVSYNEGQTWQPLGVAATGAGGMDGITPQLSIGADMCWQVSYDNGNTWTSLNVKAQGMDGANGINGADGRDGVNGTNGTDGRDGTDGKNGRDGVNGTNGMDGKNGANGLTPHIRENGNWYIGDTDTGVAAAGKDGKNGKDGMNGRDGINGVDGKDGKDGADGKDGVGVSAVAIDAEGSLLVTFTDENMVNVGTIPTNDQKLDEVKTLSTTSAATTGTSLAAVIAFAMYLFFKRNK